MASARRSNSSRIPARLVCPKPDTPSYPTEQTANPSCGNPFSPWRRRLPPGCSNLRRLLPGRDASCKSHAQSTTPLRCSPPRRRENVLFPPPAMRSPPSPVHKPGSASTVRDIHARSRSPQTTPPPHGRTETTFRPEKKPRARRPDKGALCQTNIAAPYSQQDCRSPLQSPEFQFLSRDHRAKPCSTNRVRRPRQPAKPSPHRKISENDPACWGS